MARRSLYVGGLDPQVGNDIVFGYYLQQFQVTEEILWAAFIPFGELLDVTMPLDNDTQQHRGFAFIEFELPEDAASAKENMDDSEMFGRRLRVAYTRPSSIGAGKPRKSGYLNFGLFF